MEVDGLLWWITKYYGLVLFKMADVVVNESYLNK